LKKKRIKQICGAAVLALGVSGVQASVDVTLIDTIDQVQNIGDITLPLTIPGSAAAGFSTGSKCANGCTLGDVSLFIQGNDDNLTGHGPATAGNYKLELLEDDGGALGSLVAEMIAPQFLSNISAANVFSSPGNVTLAANTNYWVKLSSTGNGEDVLWYRAGTAGDSPWIFDPGIFTPTSGTGLSGLTPLQLKVEAVSNVPLPPAFLLMGSALMGLFMRRKITSR